MKVLIFFFYGACLCFVVGAWMIHPVVGVFMLGAVLLALGCAAKAVWDDENKKDAK